MSLVTKLARKFISKRKEPYVFRPPKDTDFDIDLKKVGLYIHIPFCKEICDFCPYNKVRYNDNLAEKYSKALLKELRYYKEKLPSDAKITSVYIGGGTPTVLLDRLDNALDFLKENFGFKGDIGLEVHPKDADPETLSQLQNMGVNMISLGVQSFDQGLLEKMGRRGARFSNKKVAKRAINFGFDCVDIDLIFSDERPNTSLKDFKTAINLDANQVSAYPLIPFSYTKWGKEYLKEHNFLWRQFRKRNFLNNFAKIAKNNDYERSSIWSFTKKTSAQYSSVTRYPFLGVGAGATSCFEDKFLVNTFSPSEYIKAVDKNIPVALQSKLSQRDREVWWLFWQLYNTKISQVKFREIFGPDFKKEFSGLIKSAKLLGYFKESDDVICLSKKGINLFHVIELIYTRNYLETVWGKCLEEPWPDEIKLL